jgi:tripartite-type tricarboxylate transporter receptor subunit TctC
MGCRIGWGFIGSRNVIRMAAAGAALALLAAHATPAPAQGAAYPTKPIRFLIGSAPGGGLDITARIVGPKLAGVFGQQIVVDNRPGAAGSLAAAILAKAAPDGYTLLLGAIGNLAVNVSIYRGLDYHPLKDFSPVTFAVSQSNVLVVHPSVPAKTVQELIDLARAQPGKLTYGSSGSGNAGHLAGELFKSMARVDLIHVPYKGGAPAMLDLVAGQIQAVFSSAPTAVPQIKAAKIKALAVTTARRSALLPDLPTIAESGLPGYETDNWYGVVVTAGTPRSIINRLNAEVVRALNLPDVKEALFKLGLETAPGTPQDFGAYMKAEYTKWAKVVGGTKVN